MNQLPLQRRIVLQILPNLMLFATPNLTCRIKLRPAPKRRSIHAPNLTDELSTTEEQRLNQFDSAGQVWCGKQH